MRVLSWNVRFQGLAGRLQTVVDSIADINLVYTEHARRNLLREGHPPHSVVLSGSPMNEVLRHYGPRIEASTILEQEGLSSQRYFVVSLHREENVDDKDTLLDLVAVVDRLCATYAIPAIISLHPRTARRLDEFGISIDPGMIRVGRPFGFFDYNKLQQHARFVISDSGTISEESALLQFSAVSPRSASERPEGIESGAFVLSGLDPDDICAAVGLVDGRSFRSSSLPPGYGIQDCSYRVLSVLLSRPMIASSRRR